MDCPTLSVYHEWPKFDDIALELKPAMVGLPYTNLQWSRKWFDVGQWSAVVPADVFDDASVDPLTWANFNQFTVPSYVMLSERFTKKGVEFRDTNRNPTEMGLIQCVTYDEESNSYTLSGFFGEDALNWGASSFYNFGANQTPQSAMYIACFDDAINNVGRKPQSLEVMTKESTWKSYSSPTYAPSQINDKITWDVRKGYNYGAKMREWGEPRLLGVRVAPTTLQTGAWTICAGFAAPFDLSTSQTKLPVKYFSDKLGNLSNGKITYDYSNFRSCCLMSYVGYTSSGEKTPNFARVDRISQNIAQSKYCFVEKYDEEPQDDMAYSDYVQSVRTDALSELAKYAPVITINGDSDGDDGYLTEWDLGDIVMVRIKGHNAAVQIVGINEVYKNGAGTLSLTFGSRILSNIERAIR